MQPQPQQLPAVPVGLLPDLDERHPGRRGMREELLERPDPDVALPDLLVAVLEGAPHVHRVVGVDESETSGPADLDDPVHGRGRATRLVEGSAGGEHVAGVEADPCLGVVVEGVDLNSWVELVPE